MLWCHFLNTFQVFTEHYKTYWTCLNKIQSLTYRTQQINVAYRIPGSDEQCQHPLEMTKVTSLVWSHQVWDWNERPCKWCNQNSTMFNIVKQHVKLFVIMFTLFIIDLNGKALWNIHGCNHQCIDSYCPWQQGFSSM